MRSRFMWATMAFAAVMFTAQMPSTASAAGNGQPTDWNRFMHYPYVYYPHNFQSQKGSYDHMYHRYAPENRIPVYNKNWYNPYPSPHPYHKGHHFILDVF